MTELKTKIQFVESPLMTETTLMGDPNKFIEAVKEHKKVFVEIFEETKSSISIGLRMGSLAFKINEETPGLKYLHRSHYSFLSSERYDAYYLKAKSMRDVQRHIEAVLSNLKIELDGLSLIVYNTEKVKHLRTIGN